MRTRLKRHLPVQRRLQAADVDGNGNTQTCDALGVTNRLSRLNRASSGEAQEGPASAIRYAPAMMVSRPSVRYLDSRQMDSLAGGDVSGGT